MRALLAALRTHPPTRRFAKRLLYARLPTVTPLGAVLYHGRDACLSTWAFLKSKLLLEQMLRYRCTVGQRGFVDAMPYIYGDGSIVLGDDVRIGPRCTFVVGLKVYPDAVLEIGHRVRFGYENMISVAQRVTIGDDCMIAGETKIFDNNSHSLDYHARRQHAPLKPGEVAPVVIEHDVWICANVTILKGVRVGYGSVIGAGSVVVRDVPPLTMVAGNPARVVKKLGSHDDAA